MTSTTAAQKTGLHRGTNWWGAFVIGLAGPILVTGIDPPAVQALGAAAVPLIALATAMGVLLCVFAAELAAVMPHRTGGLPSYTTEAFDEVHRGTARHLGGLSAWAYWLGWFPVAPINMILASAYIIQLFGIPKGPSYLPFGSIGSPVTLSVLIISVVAIAAMYIPSYLGIRLGAGFATFMGIVSMAPLTVLILLPLFRPGSMHFGNLAGFHFAPSAAASPTLIIAWLFVMTWSVLAMEAAACYLGECGNPSRDAKIAMTVEGIYGFFIFVMTAVVLVLVIGVADNVDPLTIFSTFISKITGSSGGWVQWVIGVPLILALLLSVLNAIMGCARSLFQASADGVLPRWFGHLNKHGVPDRAMAFNVACSAIVLLFGSPLRIYIFSNIGYLFACMMGFFAYFAHRQTRPSVERPVRLPGFMRWVALAIGLVCAVLLVFGGWNSPSVVLSSPSHSLFLLGVLVLAAYAPLHLWRRFSDRRADVTPAPVAIPELAAEPEPA
ncbi:APC family permease [Mycobacterium sp.]|jgi:amino acid transporter|uniref:APC family permease n=1 Tax=Mycobacterium sp. TaxID=1785 RepID=UPI002D4B3946|nr:APC family permease [Mycobacterium sp.]HZA11153.1 APC family permease [Mycobacterium sp.]